MPFAPLDGEEAGHGYEVKTRELKMISDYSRLSFNEIQMLEIDEYMLLVRDAFIYKLNQSEAGKEYLETAWILEQSTPDRKSLRDNFKR